MQLFYCECCGKRGVEAEFSFDEIPLPTEPVRCNDCREGYGVSTGEVIAAKSNAMDALTAQVVESNPKLQKKIKRRRSKPLSKKYGNSKKPRRFKGRPGSSK